MPEQITPLSILYLLLHGAGTAVCIVLFLYLLLCRGKAIAPDRRLMDARRGGVIFFS